MPKDYKNKSGATLVIASSSFYTGPAYFVSKSSVYTGTNLVFVLCFSNSTCKILKTLLPTCIITPRVKNIKPHIKRIKNVVIGPGLNRNTEKYNNRITNKLTMITKLLREKNVIVDGDGLFYFDKIYGTLFNNNNFLIGTFNIFEAKKFDKIKEKFNICVLKGETDELLTEHKQIKLKSEFVNKNRCGGQGDVLCGIIASSFSHNTITLQEKMKRSCNLLRKVGNYCFYNYDCNFTVEEILNALKFFKF